MKEIRWYFPDSTEEAWELYKEEKTAFHAGGTGLLMGGLSNLEGLIDLANLKLDRIDKGTDRVEIGAMATYRQLAYTFGKNCLLGRAADKALPPALSNSVTIGGNLAMFPAWSDMAGPMAALNAKMHVFNGDNNTIDIMDYLDDTKFRKNSLLLKVSFNRHDFLSFSYRAKRTEFDYPAFTISMLARKNDDEIFDSRIAVTGTKNGVERLENLEVMMNGRSRDQIEPAELASSFQPDFRDKPHGSADYLAHLLQTELERGIEKLKGGLS